MTFETNFASVINTINSKLTALQGDEMCREQAYSLLAVLKDRIHIQGKDSNGAQIGTYTPAYIKWRQKKAKRNADPKVIISFTRQLENGWSAEQLTTGEVGYALCLRTQEDMQKAHWCEETYQKPIFAPTAEERVLVQQIGEDYIARHLS